MSLIRAAELRKQRKTHVEAMRELIASVEGPLQGEALAKFEKMEARDDEMRAEIEQIESDEAREARMIEREAEFQSEERRASVGQPAARERVEKEELNKRYERAFTNMIRAQAQSEGGLHLLSAEDRQTLSEFRAQSVGTDADGGYLVPETWETRIEEAMLQYGAMLNLGTEVRTSTGGPRHFPTADDTSNSGQIEAENTTAAEQDLTFGELILNDYLYSSDLIRASYQILQDSAVDLPTFIGRAQGIRIGRVASANFTTGTGTAQPNGIVTASTAGKTAASATAITHDELLDLKHSVDPAYRVGPQVGWMFKDSTLLYVKKLKDSNGLPLWQASTRVGEPDTLDGDRWYVNQDMAAIATTAKTVLYGDYSKYLRRRVKGTTQVTLRERYAEFFQMGFLAHARMDGDLLDAGTNPVKHLVQA